MKKGLTATLNRGAAGGLVKDEKNIKAKKDLEDLLSVCHFYYKTS